MDRNLLYGELLNSLIPGGGHTYSKGNDQWPENAPSCIARGKGAHVWDANDKMYIDWSMGLTSVSLGHAHDEVNEAAISAISLGHNFQRPSVMEAQAAEKFLSFLNHRGEMVKFAKNGSTVTTAAVKLARAITGRSKIAICAQHPFFSYDDWFIGSTRVKAGIPRETQNLTIKFSYNSVESIEDMFAQFPNEIAGVILEPVKFEAPKPEFLRALRTLCSKNGSVLILDEMVTGFKWHNQGAGAYFDIEADLYTWGKGMANGWSVCALTGRRDIMKLGGINHAEPRVFLASTTHGAEIPPLAAFIKTLEIFERDDPIAQNWKTGARIKQQLQSALENAGVSKKLKLVGDECLFALVTEPTEDLTAAEIKTYLMQELIKEGQLWQGLFYPTPSHNAEIVEKTTEAWAHVLPRVKNFLESGDRSLLIGEAVRPVFRKFNNCTCINSEECARCSSD